MNENLNNLERELKIMLTKEQYDQIRSDISFDRCYRQTNTYYDTPDQKLKQMGGAFRIRQLPDHSVITLKLPSDAITKQEYEYPTKATSPETLSKEELQLLQEKAGIQPPLRQTASFTTLRCEKKLEHAELCLDQTDFGSVTDYELEYEYSDDHNGIRVFNQFLSRYGLKFEKNRLSKLGRAISYSSNL